MSDKAMEVAATALARYDSSASVLWSHQTKAERVLAALKAAGIALVELQDVNGLNFMHEDGTAYTPAELRHFAGEALAAANYAEESE